MIISICIPQYNRINYLLKSLKLIEQQTYNDIEIIISDDCSVDNTEEEIKKLIPVYKYPITYHKNERNRGYDYNYRNCIALAKGEYAFVIGNDDSINGADSIQFLVDFLKANDHPDLGYCNMLEESSGNTLIERAHSTKVIGSGAQVALNYYSVFSFVGGLIYKKSVFNIFNTDKHDGSIYAQLYLGCYMIANGCKLFSIKEPLVLKDVVIEHIERNSYRDTIARKWKDYKKVNGGLPSVIKVLLASFKDAGVLDQNIIYKIYRKIYSTTFPYWVQDYKYNNALPEAVGMVHGMYPYQYEEFKLLNWINKVKITLLYICTSIASLLFPTALFSKIKSQLYKRVKK